MDKAIDAVIEAVKNASPVLWAAAQEKVQADIVNAHFWMMVWIGIAAILGVVFLVLLALGFITAQEEVAGPAVFCLIVGLVSLLPAAACYTDILVREKAPQWYALQALVELSPIK